jgi:ribosomal protein S12 methylthiotransferase
MEDLVFIGRTQAQAPEIDGVVYLSETDAAPGKFVDVTITDAAEYDLMGKAKEV